MLDPKKGAYFGVVACLDFASLYPSIMRAHNLSPEAWVRNRDETVPHAAKMCSGEVFVQQPTGILTLLLQKWASDRKLNKKKMMEYEKLAHEHQSETYRFMEKVFDARQKANKVCMNSLYGFCGVATRGMQSCPQIAFTVTSIGREMIDTTASACKRMLPDSEVIYGDSVAGDTPLLINTHGDISFITIENLFGKANLETDGKQYARVEASVWSDKGFTPIKHVMRHRTTKRMFRVYTAQGVVDVTEDHSLLLEDGSAVQPTGISSGTKLLHHTMPHPKLCNQTTVEEATMTAYFFQSFYNQLITFQDADGRQKVPSSVLFAPTQSAYAFLEKCWFKPGVTTVHGKLAAAGIAFVGNRLGYSACIDIKDDICRVDFTKDAGTRVHKVVDLGVCTGYVYDLETENHHFHVGPGNLIVHNTDSVFWDLWPGQTIHQNPNLVKEAFRYCEDAAEKLSELFPDPNKLEFEKVFCPLLLFGKKRYSGQLYSADLGPEKPKKIDNKGLQLVRRDSIPFLKSLMNDVLQTIHKEFSHYKASRLQIFHSHLFIAVGAYDRFYIVSVLQVGLSVQRVCR